MIPSVPSYKISSSLKAFNIFPLPTLNRNPKANGLIWLEPFWNHCFHFRKKNGPNTARNAYGVNFSPSSGKNFSPRTTHSYRFACGYFKKLRLVLSRVVLVYINCLLLFSLANIAERRVRPYVCVIV